MVTPADLAALTATFAAAFPSLTGRSDLAGLPPAHWVGVLRRLPLVFASQPEGGFTVTSPVLPELVTEGDALATMVELHAEQGRPLPQRRPIAGPCRTAGHPGLRSTSAAGLRAGLGL